jgi:hypothetical protein
MVKAVYYSPLATCHSLLFHQSLFASRHSPFTIRHSLLAFFSARQEPRPPNSVPLPSRVSRLLSRSKSALQFLRHQLRTEVRSHGLFLLYHQPFMSLALASG